MTIAANLMPSWVTYVMYPPPGADDSEPFWMSLGLHQSCTNTSPPMGPPTLLAGWLSFFFKRGTPTSTSCRSFPHRSVDCGTGPSQQFFCSVWRTIGFLMAVALVAELVTLVGFAVVLCGGRMKRRAGWRMLVPLLEGAALVQLVAMALVTYLMDHDERFLVPGWHLGTAWTLCTVSWSVTALCGMGLALAAHILPPEDGYDFLEDPEDF